MTTLQCKECDTEFTKTTNGGTHLFCSQKCQVKNWAKNNPDSRTLSAAKWRRTFPKRHRLNQLRARANEKNLEFNLTEDDLETPSVCPVLGIPLKRASFKQSWNSPSVDRIDNSKGYTKDNVRVISKRANTLKSDATIEELELILADARKLCPQYMDPLT